MNVSRDAIRHDVRVCIDEQTPLDANFESEYSDSDMDVVIDSKLAEAIRFVYSHADLSLLDISVVTATCSEDGVGRWVLPDYFIRLAYCTMSSWGRWLGESNIIPYESPEYSMLLNELTTGTKERPRISIGWNGVSRQLELWKGNAGETVTVGYVEMPLLDDSVDISEKLYPSIVYCIASLVLGTYREDTYSAQMLNRVMMMLSQSQRPVTES